MAKTTVIKACTNRLYKAIHHVGWGDNISASLSLGNRSTNQQLKRLVIHYITAHMAVAFKSMHHAAMTMIRKFA
ncbi:hypothetical protein D3C71_2077650 [compost metagenome]